MQRLTFHASRPLAGLAALLAALALVACQGTSPTAATGTVVSTVGETVPMGLEPAHIISIDGRSVFPTQRAFALAPGVHEIRVSPHVEGPSHQVPTHYAMIRELANDPLELEVQAGWTYFIALRVIETPDYTNRVGYWQATVARALEPREARGEQPRR